MIAVVAASTATHKNTTDDMTIGCVEPSVRVLPVHSTPGMKGAASIVMGDRVDGVSGILDSVCIVYLAREVRFTLVCLSCTWLLPRRCARWLAAETQYKLVAVQNFG
jgi:hypothetical protein